MSKHTSMRRAKKPRDNISRHCSLSLLYIFVGIIVLDVFSNHIPEGSSVDAYKEILPAVKVIKSLMTPV